MVVIVTNNLLRLIGGDSALSVFAIVNRLYSGLNTPQTGIMQGMQPIWGITSVRSDLAGSGKPSPIRWVRRSPTG